LPYVWSVMLTWMRTDASATGARSRELRHASPIRAKSPSQVSISAGCGVGEPTDLLVHLPESLQEEEMLVVDELAGALEADFIGEL